MAEAAPASEPDRPRTCSASSATSHRCNGGEVDKVGDGGRPTEAATGVVAPGGHPSKPVRESPLLVLKVGTSTLMVSDETGQRLNLANVGKLVDLIGDLRRRKYQVVLVSSGAVGMGCIKLGITQKPTCLRTKQAVAAAGQSQLMRLYEDLFSTVRLQVAQLLISQSDFLDKDHWCNVKATIQSCLSLGLVPIINENDSTNTAELRFGDNDNLAALTAVQMNAEALFLFTDVDYLYTANPRTDPTAQPLRIVPEPWALQVDTSGGSGLGTGGMQTKIVAARTAATAGIPCGVINGQNPERLNTFLDYGLGSAAPGGRPLPHGTYFMAMAPDRTVGDTRRWILSLPVNADLLIDDGCAKALADKKSLLPIGILKVQGSFTRYECTRLVHRGGEIGRAIVNFTSEELGKIRGSRSTDFENILGYTVCAEACHRSNVILTVDSDSLRSFDVPGKLSAVEPSKEKSPMKRNSSFS